MLERFAEEDRLEQMNMQAGAGRACGGGVDARKASGPTRITSDATRQCCTLEKACATQLAAWETAGCTGRTHIHRRHTLPRCPCLLQRRRAKQAEHMREVERLLAYRRQLYQAMRVRVRPMQSGQRVCACPQVSCCKCILAARCTGSAFRVLSCSPVLARAACRRRRRLRRHARRRQRPGRPRWWRRSASACCARRGT